MDHQPLILDEAPICRETDRRTRTMARKVADRNITTHIMSRRDTVVLTLAVDIMTRQSCQ